MKIPIYIASKAIHRPHWRTHRDEYGVNIISRWIDTDDKYSTNPDGLDYEKLWSECLEDIWKSKVLICYVAEGEILKGALIEIGAATALGKPVLLCGHKPTFEENGTWFNLSNVMYCDERLGDALRYI